MYFDVPEHPGLARVQETGYPADDAEIPCEDSVCLASEVEDT